METDSCRSCAGRWTSLSATVRIFVLPPLLTLVVVACVLAALAVRYDRRIEQPTWVFAAPR